MRTWVDKLERPLALVMGGGAALGAIQVGMLRALFEYGIEPDLIVGTSVGALNGSFMACDFTTQRQGLLEDIWLGLDRDSVFPDSDFMSVAKMLATGRRHLTSNDALRELIDSHLPEAHGDLDISTTVLGTDILTGEKVKFSSGRLREHVLISASIPLIFDSIEHDGRHLVDGGVAANVPVLPANELGAKSMIVLDPGYPCALSERPDGLLGYILHLVTVMIRHQARGALHFLDDTAQVLYVPPPCPLDVAPHDFTQTSSLFEAGHDTASEFFEGLQLEGCGIYGHPHIH